jgi:hypothetical protein
VHGAAARGYEPDKAVEHRDPKKLPFERDPAPNAGRAIDPSSGLTVDKEQHDGRDKGEHVRRQQVPGVQRTELLERVATEEGEIDVARHAKGPKRIDAQKPVAVVSRRVTGGSDGGGTHIWIRKAWN